MREFLAHRYFKRLHFSIQFHLCQLSKFFMLNSPGHLNLLSLVLPILVLNPLLFFFLERACWEVVRTDTSLAAILNKTRLKLLVRRASEVKSHRRIHLDTISKGSLDDSVVVEFVDSLEGRSLIGSQKLEQLQLESIRCDNSICALFCRV